MSLLAVSDDACQQAHRMYHVYGKNLLVCIVPSITISALFGEFVFPLVPSVCLPSSLNCDFVVSGCILTHIFSKPIMLHNQKILDHWSTVAFSFSLLQVPANPINLLEIILTQRFLNSAIACS